MIYLINVCIFIIFGWSIANMCSKIINPKLKFDKAEQEERKKEMSAADNIHN